MTPFSNPNWTHDGKVLEKINTFSFFEFATIKDLNKTLYRKLSFNEH